MTTPNIVEIEARSYELDPYGHLNNAVFVNWLEHGRLAYLSDRSMSYDSIPKEYSVFVVVVHQNVAFKAQIRLGDRLTVTSRIVRFGKTSFAFDQVIAFPDGRSACVAVVTMVCVGRQGESVGMPEALRRRLES